MRAGAGTGILAPLHVQSPGYGIVYSGGKAWTVAHDTWLTRQHFDRAGTHAAFEDAYEAVVLATDGELRNEATSIRHGGPATIRVHSIEPEHHEQN